VQGASIVPRIAQPPPGPLPPPRPVVPSLQGLGATNSLATSPALTFQEKARSFCASKRWAGGDPVENIVQDLVLGAIGDEVVKPLEKSEVIV
jgi:hypothetical protein